MGAALSALAFLALFTKPVPAAQQPDRDDIAVHVYSREGAALTHGVRLVWSEGNRVFTADRNGVITVPRPSRPREAIVSSIGYRRQRITLGPTTANPLRVTLEPAIAELPDLIAPAPDPLVQSGSSEWHLEGAAMRLAPATVEPDPFRILRMVPAVSFSSILSARPLIRGIDAADAAFAIDGHEVLNLFHLGRFFSAFPALATERLVVSTHPATVAMGRTTSGRIEIEGKHWQPGDRAELQYGLGAWSGIAGVARGRTYGVIAGRTIQGALSSAADDGSDVSLSIDDLYARLDAGLGRATTTFTAFTSRDEVIDHDPDVTDPLGPAGLDWRNVLVGNRTAIPVSRHLHIELKGSYARHEEIGRRLPARETSTDVANDSRRIGGGLAGRLEIGGGGFALNFGADLFERRLSNRLSPLDPDELPAADLSVKGTESSAFLELESPLLGGVLRTGWRTDAFNGTTLGQPRASFQRQVGSSSWFSAGVGRSGRLMHVVSDARSEPKVAYYDIWLAAGESGVPPAKVDHAAVEVGTTLGGATLRFAAFGASGDGQIDLTPEVPPARGSVVYRHGRLRVRGLEIEARRVSESGRWLGQVSYLLSASERDWGEGWVPWVLDRRHQLRFHGAFRPSPATTISAALDLATAQPYTPFIRFDSTAAGFTGVFGRENSARGRFGARLDLAIQRAMRGPFGTDLAIGLSVANIALGDQSAREYSVRFPVPGGGPTTAIPASAQLFTLPPLPSLLVRLMF